MVREILPARRLICLTTLLTATQPTGLSCQMSLRATKCHRNEKTQNPWKNAPKQQKETEEKMVFGWRKKKGIQGDCFGHTEGGGGVVHDRREGVWVFGGGGRGGRDGECKVPRRPSGMWLHWILIPASASWHTLIFTWHCPPPVHLCGKYWICAENTSCSLRALHRAEVDETGLLCLLWSITPVACTLNLLLFTLSCYQKI